MVTKNGKSFQQRRIVFTGKILASRQVPEVTVRHHETEDQVQQRYMMGIDRESGMNPLFYLPLIVCDYASSILPSIDAVRLESGSADCQVSQPIFKADLLRNVSAL